MPDPTGGLLLGGAALWLISQLKGGSSVPSGNAPPGGGAPGATGGATPNAQPSGISADAKWGIGAAISLLPTVVAAGGAIAKGAAGGAAAVTAGTSSGTGTGAAGGTGAGSGAGSTAGSVTGAVASSLVAADFVVTAAWLAALVIYIVGDAISGAINTYNAALQRVFQEMSWNFGFANTNRFFIGFVKAVGATGDQNRLWKVDVSKLPPQLVRDAVATAIYLRYRQGKARNDALLNFYRTLGWNQAQMDHAPIGGEGVVEDYDAYFSSVDLTQLARDTVGYQAEGTVRSGSTPLTFGELEGDARELLGDKFDLMVANADFAGKALALAAAASQSGSTFWPGDENFSTQMRDTVVPGWNVVSATYWTAGKSPLNAWWLVDPVTGNRVAPAEMLRNWALVISVKGMAVSPGVFAGFAGRRVVGRGFGRRFGIVGSSSSQCVQNGEFVPCPTVDGKFVDVARTDIEQMKMTRAPNNPTMPGATLIGGGGSMALPLVAAGAAALYFLTRRRG